jgi:Uma2 family endonuclease
MKSMAHSAKSARPRKGALPYEEFLAEYSEESRAEWVNGEVFMMVPASSRHQRISDFLLIVIKAYVETRGLGEAISAPFQMKTGPDLPGREPDLLFVATPNLKRLESTHLRGPADLAVEVISPESRLRDRGEKFAEYELGGVREYWLVDPELERADFYTLGEDGRFRRLETDENLVFRSLVLPNFWLNVQWLWQDPLPPVLQILEELGLIK